MEEVVGLAVRALAKVEVRKESEKLALSEASAELGISDRGVIGFAHRLVLEVLKKLSLLDEAVRLALGGRDIQGLKPGVRAFLRLFAYRSIVEGAEPRELIRFAEAGREVLGLGPLRPVEKALGRLTTMTLDDVLSGKQGDDRLALELGVPRWLLEDLYRDLGRPLALDFLRSCLSPTPTYVRINTLRGGEKAILRSLSEEGFELGPVEGLRYVYEVLEAGKPILITRAYREGQVYVQDKASCLAVEVAGPEPGMVVLDVCAAPGAKTSYMAQLMGNEGAILSLDFSPRRMRAWRALMSKLGVKIAHPILADARFPLPARLKADLVLLDLPCTSTGAFSKTPSARWRLTPRSARNMARVQYRILDACSNYVKPGGLLVYITCSVLVEEDEAVIERFLRTHPDFELEEARPRLGLPGLRGLKECQRLFPHLHACDGYFIAKLRMVG